MTRSACLAFLALLCSIPVPSFPETMPSFKVEAGDGFIRFDNVVVREHAEAGATLINAVAINRTGCNFKWIDIDLVLVAGEGDRIDRVRIENFLSNAAVTLADRRVPGPAQEVQSVRGIAMRGPMVCAKALAEEKAARERKAFEAERKRAEETAARQKAVSERAARIAAVAAKQFRTGFAGLFLGMTVEDVDIMLQDEKFPWESRSGRQDDGWLLHRKKNVACNIGRAGSGSPAGCHEVESVRLELSKGRVVRIRARSPEYPPENFDTSVRGWAECALEGLKSRHGNPTRVVVPPSKVKPANFARRGRTPFVEWKKKTESIGIAGGYDQSRMTVEVVFEDRATRRGN
jgi:hypothetical protein